MNQELSANATLSHYRIVSKIGAGGMGEVYLAEDTRLRRKVALKVLSADLTQNEDRLRRFEQEARAASALNHPNILMIFEIGQADSTHYIATEFVEGETLRRQIVKSRMSLNEVLEISIQVAGAIVAAHSAGIIHRDIKPENVMVRPDGYIKVLDFGLAKLADRTAFETDTQAPTVAKVSTDPGTVMGTVTYMSPEQARGITVDERSDVFSLGVVIYEMLAGRMPFEGETTSDVIASILKTDPLPLARYSSEVTPELQWIVSKALRKDRDERYQTAKELLGDLKNLRRESDIQAAIQRSVSAESRSASTVAAAAGVTASQPTVSTGDAGVRTSSVEVILSEIKRHKRGAALALAALVVAVAGLAFGLYKWIGHDQSKPGAPFQAAKLTAITTNGRAAAAAISPDGKYVAYAMDEDRKQSLWVRQVATASSGPIVPADDVLYTGLSFSRDGNYLYYVTRDRNNMALTSLYQTTILGHNPRMLMTDVRTFSFSPDGNRFARIGARMNRSELIVAITDGSNEQKLAARKLPDNFGFNAPVAWSPDGKVIACVAGSGGKERYETLVTVNVEGGVEKPLSAHRWGNISSVAWLADGSGLIVSALDRELAPNSQLFHLSYPGGEERKITNDLNDYRGVSLTAGSTALITLEESRSLSLWIAPNRDTNSATQITSRTGKNDGEAGIAWTPDGRIVYYSTASGNADLWIMNADGSNQKQLTMNAGQNVSPAVSADGRYLAFVSNRAGAFGIWRMNLDGSNLKQLTSEGQHPQCSPDGKWVVYHGSSPPTLWKVPMEGGTPVQLADSISHYAAISPDGKMIAYFSGPGPQAKIAVMPFEGGPPIKTFDHPPAGLVPGLRWTPDGRALTYSRGSDIWSQPLDGGPPTQLTDFKAEGILKFEWSRDGRLIVSRGVTNRDVVLINFR